MSSNVAIAASVPRPGFFRIVAPIVVGHFCSHWFQYLLPPLFPLLHVAYGVDYVQLGILVTAFYIPSGLVQTFAGLIVDRMSCWRAVFWQLPRGRRSSRWCRWRRWPAWETAFFTRAILPS
jgi:MFS family permease